MRIRMGGPGCVPDHGVGVGFGMPDLAAGPMGSGPYRRKHFGVKNSGNGWKIALPRLKNNPR
jgi:hypothetical protein